LGLSPLFTQIEQLQPYLDQGAAVLTPNRRLTRAVREAEHRYRARDGKGAWDSTTITPLRQYWLDIWQRGVTRGLLRPRKLLDVSSQRLLWRRVIADDSQGFSLLSEPRAAALCQEAAERLALWCLDPHTPALGQLFGFDEDGAAFLRWHRRFCDLLIEMDAVTPEAAIAELLDKPWAREQPLALLHLEDLPPLYRLLCERARGCKRIEFAPRQASCLPTRVFSDTRGELAAVARWCLERAQDNPEGRYAVVLSDMEADRDRLEYLLRREFDCLTSNYESLPVNFATGFALDRLPLIRDALRVLDLARDEIRIESFVALLHSRFVVQPPLQPVKLEVALRRLRELCREQIPQRLFREMLQPAVDPELGRAPWELIALLEGDAGLYRRKRSPSQWLVVFAHILEAWQWSRGRSLDSLEYQQLTQWQEALDAFACLDPVTGELGYSEALARLRELLAEQPFQPRTGDSAIQVLGPLETTGLNFDALWVTGMTAARWPSGARPNPYIPNRLQREHRMPHADAHWEWSWARQRWAHWMHGASLFQASFVNQSDGAAQLPSPLLRDVPVAAPEDELATDSRWLAQTAGADFDLIAPGRIPLSAQESAARSVGSYVLEQQSLCPFQAFAATRLSAAPHPGYAAGLLPSERGTLLHRALFHLFGELAGSAELATLEAAQESKLLDAALEFALQGISRPRRDVLGTDLLALESQRLAALLRQWLRLERERAEPFTVVAREDEREITLAGLHMRLRLDRVDRLSDGSELILDYKSGAPDSIKRWFEERPARPQLPLYALLEPPAGGIAYASLKPGELGFAGVGQRAFEPGISAADDWLQSDQDTAVDDAMQELRVAWRAALEALAREFVDGESRVDPTADACRYCQRFSLCRVGELQP
jgi:ATP-dependent helicase/nuclease subunit B